MSYFAQGKWIVIPTCTNILTDTQGAALPQVAGSPTQYTYYAQCDISSAVQGRTSTTLMATFASTSTIAGNSTTWPYENASVTASTAFANSINTMIASISGAGGQGTLGAGSLPCVGVFLIMGLLLASLYFSGKSPISCST